MNRKTKCVLCKFYPTKSPLSVVHWLTSPPQEREKKKKALICQFPRCKYCHHGWFQATSSLIISLQNVWVFAMSQREWISAQRCHLALELQGVGKVHRQEEADREGASCKSRRSQTGEERSMCSTVWAGHQITVASSFAEAPSPFDHENSSHMPRGSANPCHLRPHLHLCHHCVSSCANRANSLFWSVPSHQSIFTPFSLCPA